MEKINDRKLAEEVIDSCSTCFVGITDLCGKPYVIPMNFCRRGDFLYLHSGHEGSKLDMLKRDNRVCITFCTEGELVCQHPSMACSYSVRAQSVLCHGVVTFVKGRDQKREIMLHFMHHYTTNEVQFSDAAIDNLLLWEVKIAELSARELSYPKRQKV